MSVDRLIERIIETKNPTVAGLDPRLEYIPPEIMKKNTEREGETLEAAAGAYLEFNKGLLDALRGTVPAVKLQSACYEMLGPAGMRALRESQLYAKELGYFVITDAKRGDIGSTSEAYSAAFLGRVTVGSSVYQPFPSDALTVNPYLGSDNLNAFLADCEKYDKMVFVLCKTSNRSSIEVQELPAGDRPLYRVIAENCSLAGRGLTGKYGYSKVGIVVGATHPSQLQELRRRHEDLFFLVPGYGAQGGKAGDVSYAFDQYGRGAIVNNSRGIMRAWEKTGLDYQTAAKRAAEQMRDSLRQVVTIV